MTNQRPTSSGTAAEPRWLTAEEQATWRAYLLSNKLLDQVLDRQLQRDAGIPVSHYSILVALSETPDRRMRLSDLARSLTMSQSRVTHAMKSLEAQGFVQRTACDSDRRGAFATLTGTGFAALSAAAPGHVAAVRENLIDRLTPSQQAALRTICETLLEHFGSEDAWPWVLEETNAACAPSTDVADTQ